MTDRRSSILAAATRVVARHGLRGLRVEDVAAEAGVATSLIYYHYRNREGLVQATLERANDLVAARVAGAANQAHTGRSLTELLLVADFDADEELRETAIVWGEVTASAVFDRSLRREVQEASETWVASITDTISRGVEDGSIPPRCDPREAAVRLTALVEGLTLRWLAGTQSREQVLRTLQSALAVEFDSPQLTSNSPAARSVSAASSR